MIALLQRVTEASVSIDGQTTASIGKGVLVFIAVEARDDEHVCARMVERILGYRIFADGNGRMNNSVGDIGGEVLLVPQFTLAADTRKGMRPGFSRGASPEKAAALFLRLTRLAAANYPAMKIGNFGADMQIALVNDGPATFLLQADGGKPADAHPAGEKQTT